jgi:hypothetical protein
MAIGTLAAIAIGAGAIGSAAISSGASSKAANAATDAANQSAAVQREQLQAAQNALNPYQKVGLPASGQINALLGLGGDTPASVDWNAYAQANPDLMAAYNAQGASPATVGWQGHASGNYGPAPTRPDLATFAQQWQQQHGGNLSPYTTPGQSAAQKAQAGYDIFKNTIGYNDTMNEAIRGVNSLYAGAGTIKSGAAIKGVQDRASQIARGTMGDYLGALGNQQALGLSAGSALAGVGQNYANSLTQINSNRADAIGNSALLNARNINNTIGGITNGIFKIGL